VKLVVGLGNPGERYEATRHNIGFMVVRQVAEIAGIALKRPGYQGFYGVGRVAGVETTLLLPQTFMNLSGASVGSACKSLGIKPGDLIIVHDDIDLPFGRLRIREGGGHGGHNGIRSIAGTLGGDFCRLKVGVGRPAAGDVADYVLSAFSSAERKGLPDLLAEAANALETILTRGTVAAMNAFNSRDNVA
jgi:PTH1 family peptidyl-tRNA hydrolase